MNECCTILKLYKNYHYLPLTHSLHIKSYIPCAYFELKMQCIESTIRARVVFVCVFLICSCLSRRSPPKTDVGNNKHIYNIDMWGTCIERARTQHRICRVVVVYLTPALMFVYSYIVNVCAHSLNAE